MAGYFNEQSIIEFNTGRMQVRRQFADLRERYLIRTYKSDRAREFAHHGFGRRLGMLARAIDLVYEKLPPENEDIPRREEVLDATIAIQSFVSNTFGCLDNLAWIWVFEKPVLKPDGTELDRFHVGFSKKHKQFRQSLSPEFIAYLDSTQKWFDHIKNFRDSLAHRIPLYIPPYIITLETSDEYNRLEAESRNVLRRGDVDGYERLQAEQRKLVIFRPWMTHSRFESAPTVVFHQQLLHDYVTIDEFGRTMLEELDR